MSRFKFSLWCLTSATDGWCGSHETLAMAKQAKRIWQGSQGSWPRHRYAIRDEKGRFVG